MDRLFEIIMKRSVPGILIFDLRNTLRYINKEASDMISELPPTEKSSGKKKQYIPEEIYSLCNLAKKTAKENPDMQPDNSNCAVLNSTFGAVCSMRAFCIGYTPEESNPTHIMVLLEKVIEKHEVDYEKIRRDFEITKREVEVLKLICEGLSNKDISKALSITEYTVKDHIKNIMRKTNASTRSEVIMRTNQK
jgi:DNA-binding NarL/FixJ family response regulator